MLKNWFKRLLYSVNPMFKDSLFRRIFGTEKYKKYALQLYNALNKSEYTRLSDLEIVTLENAVYIRMKNDVAYLICGNLPVYEHQSTWSANMPVRMLLYYAELIRRDHPLVSLYRGKGISLDTPQFVVFYNGNDRKDIGDKEDLKLSSLYKHPGSQKNPSLELNVVVYNINEGHNTELMEACETMKQYSEFVAMSCEALKGI